MAAQSVSLAGIGKGFGAGDVLAGIELAINEGEFLSLVGMSGCGKSTLLRTIAGLENPDRGRVVIGGVDVTDVDPAERNLAMVFQSYALYPHMTVRQNIATPLRMRRLSLAARLLGRLVPGTAATRRQIDAEVESAAKMLEISALLERKPAQLSGGQRQRVALARALVRAPTAFLMDEPLSNLDARLRAHMRDELVALHRRLGATFIYVTHDQVEAMSMSDRIALMEGGRILQVDTPEALYERPISLSVARFIGTPTINLLPAELDAKGRVSLLGQACGVVAESAQPGNITLGLRAEALKLANQGFAAQVVRCEMQGADRYLTLALEGGARVVLRQTQGLEPRVAAHSWVKLAFDPAQLHLFGADGARLSWRLDAQVAA